MTVALRFTDGGLYGSLVESGRAEERIGDYMDPPNQDAALDLLKRLNTLRDDGGQAFAGRVSYHGYEPWWFHQQTVFHQYLVPYTRYRRLLARLSSAKRIIANDSPAELSALLRLMFQRRCELYPSNSPQLRLQRWRRRIAPHAFRAATVIAAAVSRLRRPDALVYGIDVLGESRPRDPRIERLYRLLEDHEISFAEITWSVDVRRAIRNFWKRRWPCLYVQGFDVTVLESDGDPGGRSIEGLTLDLDDRLLLRLATAFMVPCAEISVRVIEKLECAVQALRVRSAFFIDDYRHAYELVVACQRSGIPTVGVQHGQFNAYSVGLMAYGFVGRKRHSFDRYWLWSPFFRDQLLRQSELYRESDVFVGGPAQVFEDPIPPAYRGAGQVVRVLWLTEQYDSWLQRSEVTPFLDRLINDPRVEVSIRLHPSHLRAPYILNGASKIHVTSGSLRDALAGADVVVASYSSAVFEAILHHRPVVLFATTQCRDLHGLVRQGVAFLATGPEDIVDLVLLASATPKTALRERRLTVWGEFDKSVAAAEIRSVADMNTGIP